MNNTFLYTLPQWFILAGIFVITYGWIENKKPFRLIGISILIALGIYSLIILMGDWFAASKYLTPEEIATQELEDDIIAEAPFQAQLVSAYLSFVVGAMVSLAALIFEWKDKKPGRILIIISGLIMLFGFFVIVGAIKSV